MKEKGLERKVEELERRVKYLEGWIETHHCQPLPPNIKRCIGTVLPKEGVVIPSVEE